MKMKAVKTVFTALGCVMLMAPLFEGALASQYIPKWLQQNYQVPQWLQGQQGAQDAVNIFYFAVNALRQQRGQEQGIDEMEMALLPINLRGVLKDLNSYFTGEDAIYFLYGANELQQHITINEIDWGLDDEGIYNIEEKARNKTDTVAYIMGLQKTKPEVFAKIVENLRKRYRKDMPDLKKSIRQEANMQIEDIDDDFFDSFKVAKSVQGGKDQLKLGRAFGGLSELPEGPDVEEQIPPLKKMPEIQKRDNLVQKLQQQKQMPTNQMIEQKDEIERIKNEQKFPPTQQQQNQLNVAVNMLKQSRLALENAYTEFIRGRNAFALQQAQIYKAGQKGSEAYKLAKLRLFAVQFIEESSKLEYNKKQVRLMEEDLAKLEEENQSLNQLSEALANLKELKLEKEKLEKELIKKQQALQVEQKLSDVEEQLPPFEMSEIQKQNAVVQKFQQQKQTLANQMVVQQNKIEQIKNEQEFPPTQQQQNQLNVAVNMLKQSRLALENAYTEFIRGRNAFALQQAQIYKAGQKGSEAYKLAKLRLFAVQFIEESSKLEYNKKQVRLMEEDLAKLEEENQSLNQLSEALANLKELKLEKEKLEKELIKKQQKK